MSAHDGSRATGPNFAAAVDGPNFAAAVDGPNLSSAVGRRSVQTADEPTEANIESYLRRAFKSVANVT